jgi:hypothetical protein
MTYPTAPRPVVAGLGLGLLLLTLGCATDDTTAGRVAAVDTTSVEPSPPTVAQTVAPTAASTVPATALPVPDSTAAPTTSAAPRRQSIKGPGPFDAGPYRATRTFGPRFGIDVELPVDGLYGLDETGLMSIDLAVDGSEVLVTVHHLEVVLTLEPTLDMNQISQSEYLLSMSGATPDDLLAWFTDRPGVTAVGPVETVELGGRPARRQTIEFGPFDGAQSCSVGDDRACHFYFLHPVTGYSLYQAVGDVVTVYELMVADNRVAVVVDGSIAPELAAEVAESLEFLEF